MPISNRRQSNNHTYLPTTFDFLKSYSRMMSSANSQMNYVYGHNYARPAHKSFVVRQESKCSLLVKRFGPVCIILTAWYLIFKYDREIFSRFSSTTENLYRGTPWSNERTVSIKTIGETKFARCDMHTVRTEDGKGEINDWLFLEEMDAVNVAVVTAENKVVVFEQRKYAIPGMTLSPVGGFIDEGEAPWESARREVMEELGLGSRATLEQMNSVNVNTGGEGEGGNPEGDLSLRMEAFNAIPKITRSVDEFNLALGNAGDDPDWIYLGKYRTAANRGGGFIYTYLLKNAVPILPQGGTPGFQSSGDDEEQNMKLLSIEEALDRTLKGEFQEVKWAATLSLAFLHLKR